MGNDKHITLDREYFERATERARRSGEEEYDSNGVKFSEYDCRKQIKVMEVKEG